MYRIFKHFVNVTNNTSEANKMLPIHRAAINGDFQWIKLLLESGTSVNLLDSDRMSPLHFAAMSGDKYVVQLLMIYGANKNKTDNHGRTPLHFAAMYGYPKVIDALIKNGANKNALDTNGISAFHIAAMYGHAVVIKELIYHGANKDVVCAHGITAIDIAAEKGHQSVVIALITHGADVNKAFCFAYSIDLELHQPVAFQPIKSSVDFNSLSFKETALHFIARYRPATKIIKALVKIDDILNKNAINETPIIFLAIKNGNVDTVNLLISHGINLSVTNKHGQTPIDFAIKHGSEKLIEILLLNLPSTAQQSENEIAEILESLEEYMDVDLLPQVTEESVDNLALSKREEDILASIGGGEDLANQSTSFLALMEGDLLSGEDIEMQEIKNLKCS